MTPQRRDHLTIEDTETHDDGMTGDESEKDRDVLVGMKAGEQSARMEKIV